MSQKIVKAWLCDLPGCGHVWLSEIEPDRCAKCKRGNWNRERCKEPEESFVYVVRNPVDGLYKIGTSRHPEKRIVAIGLNLEKILLFACGRDGFSFEYALHRHFSGLRHHGEWFALTQTEIDWIRGLNFFHPNQQGRSPVGAICCKCHPPKFATRPDWKDIEFRTKATVELRTWNKNGGSGDGNFSSGGDMGTVGRNGSGDRDSDVAGNGSGHARGKKDAGKAARSDKGTRRGRAAVEKGSRSTVTEERAVEPLDEPSDEDIEAMAPRSNPTKFSPRGFELTHDGEEHCPHRYGSVCEECEKKAGKAFKGNEKETKA